MATSNDLNISQAGVVSFDGTAVFTGSPLTQHDVLVGGTSNAITNVSPSTAGFVLTSNGISADPSFQDVSASGALKTLTGNSGGAISPTAGNINTLGTGSITITGSGSSLTTQLTGLNNHNVLVGAGTSTITNVAPSATTGIPFVSQGSSSDPIFGTAVVDGGGTGSTSFNINGAVYSNTTTTGALQAATLTSGQLLIGGTTTPAAATLTAGGGVSIANGNNSITISVSGGGFAWTEVTGTSQSAAVNNGYVCNNGSLVTVTLPSTAALFSIVWIVGKGAGGWKLLANTGQTINFGNQSSTTAGSISSTNQYDAIQVMCTVANTTWTCTGIAQGNLTVA